MKLVKQFRGVPDGEIYPVTYEPGDECPPELEAAARHFGALEAPAPAPAPAPTPEPAAEAAAELEAPAPSSKKKGKD